MVHGEALHQEENQKSMISDYPFGKNPEELRKTIKMAEGKLIRMKDLYQNLTGVRYKG